MHPDITTRKDENGNEIRLDVFEYLFRHAQRLSQKTLLRPINTHRYCTRTRHAVGENSKEKNAKELADNERTAENDLQRERKLFQRDLGLFNKLVVGDKGVVCTCENFRRFGMCEDSELVGFICLGEAGYPTQKHAVDFNSSKDGYPNISSKLREKVLNLVHTESTGDIHAPPPKDPSTFLQDSYKIQKDHNKQ